MTPFRPLLQFIILMLGCSFFEAPAHAQRPVQSPRDSAVISFNGKKIVINYGKPAMRGRKIMGEFVPYNRPWRTGAGEATSFVTELDIELGGMEIAAGSYTLYTFPSETQWKLIINKQTGQWGTVYNPQLDLARINLEKRQTSAPVEHLTISLERTGTASGLLKIEWERTSLAVPFRVSPEPIVPSPRDSTEIVLAGKRIVIDYGRPSARGRRIMGQVVPYNKVWRTGANAATTLKTEADLLVGDLHVPPGKYSLYTIPGRTRWTLIVNKQTGQSGLEYNRRLDLGRVTMRVTSLSEPLERFTISLVRTAESSGLLKLEWERTSAAIPFTTKVAP